MSTYAHHFVPKRHILLLPQRQLQLCALCGHLQLLVLLSPWVASKKAC